MSIEIRGNSNGSLANVDVLGNLYTLATPSAIPLSLLPGWGSATVLNTTEVLLATGGFAAILIQLNQGSPITSGALVFEGTYDGINWVSLPSGQVLNPATFLPESSTYSFQPGTNVPFLLIVGGFQQIRIRLTSVIIGSGLVTPYWTLLSNNPQAAASTVTVTNLPIAPNVFKTVQVTTNGNSPIWSPASGKSFRLLRYQVEVSLDASQVAGGVFTISFQDGTNPMPFAHDLYVPSPSLKLFKPYNSGWIDLGSTGYLSAAPNNDLNVNLSADLNAGNARVTVCGVEQ
jgi:hypothetical protein